MKPIQNPFSLYDFLGYLIPGILLILGLLLLSEVDAVAADPIGAMNKSLSSMSVELSLAALVVCYLVGQVASYVSSMTIEKYSNWSIGYPSKYLLKIRSRAFFELTTRGGECVVDVLMRLVLCALILPVVLIDLIVGKLLMFRRTLAKELDQQLVSIIQEKTRALVKARYAAPYHHGEDADFFRVYYHYAMEKCPNHYAKFQNYVALYGFTRTITLIAVILFWYSVGQALSCRIELSICLWTIPMMAAFSYLMYASFNKFYRKFSLEVLMAVCANYQASPVEA